MGIKERLSRFNNANYFSRVDNVHILDLHVGIDEKGRKAIELRSVYTPKKVTGTSAIEVNQYTKPEYNTIRFSLCDEEISGLFYKFCEDLIEQSRELKDDSEGYQVIVNRFLQWKKMFVSSRGLFLSELEIMGLIGEILFLRDHLAERIGLSAALRAWSGQELTHKDFSYQSTWVESKAISRGKTTVKISSLEQLDSEYQGELVIHMLEKMSPAYGGITLNRLVLETRDMFLTMDERDDFLAKVALQGYEYNNYYDDFVYEVSSFVRYRVDSNFPKLVPNGMPSAIQKVSYEIVLSDLSSFVITD